MNRNQKNAIESQYELSYGFYSNPSISPKRNAANALGNYPYWYYCSRALFFKCHNLTTFFSPPKNFESLLGLGLNFCPTPRHSTSDLKQTLLRFRNSLYWRNIIGKPDNITDKYEPKFYLCSDRQPTVHQVNSDL